MNSTDEQLVSRTLAGDRDAFGELVHKYQQMVFAYAFQKLRNEVDAQDVMQEVFLRAYRNLYGLRRPHRFRSWLYAIMSNECNRWLARAAKTRRHQVQLAQSSGDDLRVEPAHTVPTEGWRVDLEQAISTLSDENRVAVSMFYMGDCSLKEISEFLGVSVNTVKTKLHRARQQLGNALSEHYGRLLKSHKLKGGFLMQFMEQIRHIPAPAMGFTWSSASIGKSSFALITALFILIGLIGGRENLPIESSIYQTEVVPVSSNRWPIEVALLTPTVNSTRSSISGIPVPTGEHPVGISNRGSTEQSGRSVDREDTSASMTNGAKVSNPKLSATMTGNAVEEISYSGRVIDTDGEPVADAEILYSSKYNPSESVARTAGDGTFHFESPRLELKEWERVSIIATHPDYALGWRNLQLQNTAGVEIRLGMPGVISGRILNEDGVPIQNAVARIQVLFSDNPAMLGRDEGSLTSDAIPISPATTDANGEFILRALPQGASTNLETHGPGYAKELHFRVSVGTTGLKWQLKREGRIAGKLSYTGTGAPVGDATVAVQGIYPTTGWGRAHVDAEGNYLLTNLAPGFYNLYLFEGPEEWTAVAKEPIKVVKGQTVSNMDLTLVRGGYIIGRVIDQDTGEPLADQHVGIHDSARPESQASGHEAETDETGAYRFRAAPGRALVFVSAPHGYLDVGQTRKYVDVVEGENVAADFQFSKGAELAGRVLTEAGEPVAGVKITDMRERYKEYGRSNESGAFTVRGLQVGQKLSLRAEHTGLGLRGTAEVEVQPDESFEIRLHSYDRTRISGRVVNREGEPMPSVNIDLTHWDSQRHMGSSSTVAVTDGDGMFRGIGLIVGDEYTISANAEGYREAETELFTAKSEMSQIENLTLLPVESRFFIEGRIADTSGKPVYGARFYISQPPYTETLTGENGVFRIDDLSTAVINEVNIDHPEYAFHSFKILRANQRHDFVLIKADGYISGTVVDADGNPIERANVMVEAEEDSSGYIYSGVRANVLGEFELKHIKDAMVSIYVSADRDYKIFEGIEVNQRDLVLTLTPTEPRPEPTPEEQARRKAQQAYDEDAEERFKTLVNQPAPELAVSEWMSGPPISIGDLEDKTVALYFWDDMEISDRIHWARLLNLLQEVYGEKGLVCVAVCPATTEIETVKQHIAEHSLDYSIGLDSSTDVVGGVGETFHRFAFGWPAAPFTLINAAGEITGRVWDSELESQIQAMLAD